MHGRIRKRSPWSLLLAAGGLILSGCGGRAVSRVVASGEPPPVAEWEHPSRLGEAVPAVRLDRPRAPLPGEGPDGCTDDCGETATPPRPAGAPGGVGGGVRVSLQRGMTLYSLSRAYRVPLQTILSANDIHDPTTVRAGTEIYIPAPRRPGGAPTGPAPAPRPRPGADRAPGPALLRSASPLHGLIPRGHVQQGRHLPPRRTDIAAARRHPAGPRARWGGAR